MARNRETGGSDAELLALCREGDVEAFGVLWDRHRRAGIVAARSIAPGLDPDDLVSAAYLKILELVSSGRGPSGAFRPYLYRVISTLAADTHRSPEVASDQLDAIPDLSEVGPWEDGAFDLNAAARAFESLPERWQAALWYSEVEGMAPRQIAPLLGLSANGVSALCARAKEGLQSAWVETHVNMQLEDETCRTTREQLQRYQRGKLTARRSREVAAHLEQCRDCRVAAAEFSTLNRQLALVLATLFVGGVSATALVQQLGGAGAASVGIAGASSAGSTAGGSAGGGAGSGAGATGAAGAAAAGGGLMGTVALTAAATVVLAAVAGGGALLLPNLLPDGDSSITAEVADHGSPADHRDEQPKQPESTPPAPKPTPVAEDTAETPSAAYDEPAPVPAPRVQPPAKPPVQPPPVTPPPAGGADPALAVFDVCLAPFYPPDFTVLQGSAVSSGAVSVRITQGTTVSSGIPDFSEFYAPANPGDPWTWQAGIGGGPPVIISLTPLSQWGLVDDDIENVTVEMRFTADSGAYSPWTTIDTSVSC